MPSSPIPSESELAGETKTGVLGRAPWVDAAALWAAVFAAIGIRPPATGDVVRCDWGLVMLALA